MAGVRGGGMQSSRGRLRWSGVQGRTGVGWGTETAMQAEITEMKQMVREREG